MAEEQQYGGFWVRVVALTLDNAIVLLILIATALSLGVVVSSVGLEGGVDVLASLLVTFVPFLYWPVLESSRWRATVGKRIMGLEVTDADGNRLRFLHALLRSLAKIISSIPFGLGFVLAAFTARKQALHDIIVKSVVVRTGPSQLWKLILALIVGVILMVASAAAAFYWVLMPMLKKGFGDAVKVEMKEAPQAKTIPAPTAPPAPAAKPPAPSPQAPAAAAPAGKSGPDAEFDAIVGKPLTGLEKPGTTRAGPALLELSTVFADSFWLKVYLPVPSISDPALLPSPVVTVSRVIGAGGTDYYDAANTFEKDDFFRRPILSAGKQPVPHLAGNRSVHVRPGLSEAALQRVEGMVTFNVPVDPRAVAFEAGDAGKEKAVHDSTVGLKSLAGNTAKLHFRGASENLLTVRGYGADGKPLARDTWQALPAKQDVDDDVTVTFKGPVAKAEVVVAARIIERFYPFSLERGAVAGPPSEAGGVTVPPRARTTTTAAAAAAAAAAPAPVPAPAKPAAAPAAPEPAVAKKPEAKAEPKPEPKAELKPEPKRAPRLRAAESPAPVPAAAERPGVPGPKFNDVMTAVLYRDKAGANELLDMGHWVDKRDSNGLTPLMVAVQIRDGAMAQLLIGRGADVNARAQGGVSPLSIARETGDAAMVELLQKSGAR